MSNSEVCSRTATFQAVLTPDGAIKLQYLNVDASPNGQRDMPSHAPVSIGMENMDGSAGLQLAYDVVRHDLQRPPHTPRAQLLDARHPHHPRAIPPARAVGGGSCVSRSAVV